MPKDERRLTDPVALTKTGGSFRVTIPPAFFMSRGLDRTKPMLVEVFQVGDDVLVKVAQDTGSGV